MSKITLIDPEELEFDNEQSLLNALQAESQKGIEHEGLCPICSAPWPEHTVTVHNGQVHPCPNALTI